MNVAFHAVFIVNDKYKDILNRDKNTSIYQMVTGLFNWIKGMKDLFKETV